MSPTPTPDPNLPPLTLAGELKAIRDVTAWLHEVLSKLMPANKVEDTAGSVELALVELATNSVVHACASKVSLEAAAGPNSLTVVLRDDGVRFDADEVAAPTPDVPQVHGYGLMLVEQLTEDLVYSRHGDQNEWRAVFALEDS